MVFSLRKIPPLDLNIILNDSKVEQVYVFKFLGVNIDTHLVWANHIDYIKKKISKGLGILYKAKRYLQSRTLLTLYYSFIYPYLMYCVDVWGAASRKKMLSLLRLQKRAGRIIKFAPRLTESEPLFKSLEMLSVFKLYMLKISLVMFKFYHGKIAGCISELFVKNSEVNGRITRQSDMLHVPFTRKESVKKTIRY